MQGQQPVGSTITIQNERGEKIKVNTSKKIIDRQVEEARFPMFVLGMCMAVGAGGALFFGLLGFNFVLMIGGLMALWPASLVGCSTTQTGCSAVRRMVCCCCEQAGTLTAMKITAIVNLVVNSIITLIHVIIIASIANREVDDDFTKGTKDYQLAVNIIGLIFLLLNCVTSGISLGYRGQLEESLVELEGYNLYVRAAVKAGGGANVAAVEAQLEAQRQQQQQVYESQQAIPPMLAMQAQPQQSHPPGYNPSANASHSEHPRTTGQ